MSEELWILYRYLLLGSQWHISSTYREGDDYIVVFSPNYSTAQAFEVRLTPKETV